MISCTQLSESVSHSMNVVPKEGLFIPSVISEGNEEEKFRLSSLQHSYGVFIS